MELELSVVQQNRGGQELQSIGPGSEVLITWQPQHTFLVTKETTDG